MHEAFLADRRRQRAFRQALRAAVRPGCAVLDIGSGTGVWAIEAARLGAAEVVAVEREPLMVPVIERLARENGVADRVRVIGDDSRRVRLRRRFDVVIAELIGDLGFDEKILPVMMDARKRFLRRGGRLVPREIALLAAPARFPGRAARGANGLRLGSFRELTVHCARSVPGGALRTVAPPRRLARVDLLRAGREAGAGDFRARFEVSDLARVDGLAVWIEIGLGPGVTLTTRSGTHWSPTLLPLEPLGTGPGTLACRIRIGDRPSWEVRVASSGVVRTWRHSPLFAYGSLMPAVRRRVRRGGRRGTARRSGG